MKDRKLRKIITVLIVLALVFIWGHSAMSAEESSEESGFIYELITPFLEIFFGKGNVTEHLVRKLAHFTEHMELSVLFVLWTGLGKEKGNQVYVNCWFQSMFVALFDETIQLFSGRGSMVSDVWIDVAGATTGWILTLGLLKLLEGKRKRS